MCTAGVDQYSVLFHSVRQEAALTGCAIFCQKYESTSPVRGAKYCSEYVCLSVRSHNSKTVQPNFTNFCACFLWPRAVVRSSSGSIAICYTVCTSGFTDDVIDVIAYFHAIPAGTAKVIGGLIWV